MLLSRRNMMLAASASLIAGPAFGETPAVKMTLKSSLPKVGMGTWLTFDVSPQDPEWDIRRDVLKVFFEHGGGLIDSSPMYGRAEAAVGSLMEDMPSDQLISATKIWTPFDDAGHKQLANSHDLWKQSVLDVVCVHNLLNWGSHLKTLRAAKEAGHVRHIGLTTSHGRRHDKLIELMKTEPMDVIQLSYNILDRAAEERILPLAADKDMTVIINRPFRTSGLFNIVARHDVPEFATEFGIKNWAEYFLKYIISHPAVTCVIPATRNPDHMGENMAATNGAMPDTKMRQRMAAHVSQLY